MNAINKQQLKSKLLWRCRRGMKELDVLLVRFVEEEYFGIANAKQQAFDELLLMQDPDLYSLIIAKDIHADKDIQDVIKILNQYHQS